MFLKLVSTWATFKTSTRLVFVLGLPTYTNLIPKYLEPNRPSWWQGEKGLYGGKWGEGGGLENNVGWAGCGLWIYGWRGLLQKGISVKKEKRIREHYRLREKGHKKKREREREREREKGIMCLNKQNF